MPPQATGLRIYNAFPALLEKFDADGDGKLNAAESAKAREAFQQRVKNATP